MTYCRLAFTKIVLAATLASASAVAAELERGTILQLRLRQEVNSNSTAPGSRFEAIVVAPVICGGVEAIPAGSVVRGTVDAVQRVGLGLVHERARIGLTIHELELPGGVRRPVAAALVDLDNARETVDRSGSILGIRSTNTPGYRATGLLVSLASVEPIALLFSTTVFGTILRFSEPEIRLPAGAEFRIQLTRPLETGLPGFPVARTPVTRTTVEQRRMTAVLERMPVRNQTPAGEPSDIANVLFIGELDAISRAFAAAGWSVPEGVNAASRYRTLRAIAESQAYREAPMSELLWNGSPPVLNRAKSLNSFARRHHIRVYESPELWDGRPVYVGAATQDSGIGFSMREKSFVHLIDSWIDRERAKILDDLMLTGCVQGSELLARSGAPRDARNATGDRIVTDGGAVAILLNDCREPRRADEEVAPSPGPYRGGPVHRAARRFFLTARNDLLRDNILYRGVGLSVAGAKMLLRRPGQRAESVAVADESAAPAAADGGGWMSRIAAPPELRMMPFIAPVRTIGPVHTASGNRRRAPKEADKRWAVAPHMELSLSFGALRFGSRTAGEEGLAITKQDAAGTFTQAFVRAGNTISKGWDLGGALTVNSRGRFSHEIGFEYQRGSYELNLGSSEPATDLKIQSHFEDRRTGLLTRQFSYAGVLRLRPSQSRWTPYVSAGPALQLLHLTGAPFQKAGGMFRLGLSNVGMIRAAYNFGSSPPLEGGGIFQAALQYGAGVKFRMHPRWTLRVDYRSTLSPLPDFVSKSVVSRADHVLTPESPQVARVASGGRGFLIQNRFATGFAFTF